MDVLPKIGYLLVDPVHGVADHPPISGTSAPRTTARSAGTRIGDRLRGQTVNPVVEVLQDRPDPRRTALDHAGVDLMQEPINRVTTRASRMMIR